MSTIDIPLNAAQINRLLYLRRLAELRALINATKAAK